MSHAQRKLAAVEQAADRAALVLAGKEEGNVLLHPGRAAGAVGLHRFAEQTVAVDGVVEQRDGFMQRFRGEIAQQLLKTAERDGAFIKVLVGFREVQADAVGE